MFGKKEPQKDSVTFFIRMTESFLLYSAPRGIRTPGAWYRKPVLYPAELWAQLKSHIEYYNATPSYKQVLLKNYLLETSFLNFIIFEKKEKNPQ